MLEKMRLETKRVINKLLEREKKNISEAIVSILKHGGSEKENDLKSMFDYRNAINITHKNFKDVTKFKDDK